MHIPTIVSISVALMAMASSCEAAVYRCTSKDGSTEFSDQPCGIDAHVQQVTPQPSRNAPLPPVAIANPPIQKTSNIVGPSFQNVSPSAPQAATALPRANAPPRAYSSSLAPVPWPPVDEEVIRCSPIQGSIEEEGYRPGDGLIKEGRITVCDEGAPNSTAVRKQGDWPDHLFGLLFEHGKSRKLFPLNYSGDSHSRPDLPSNTAQLGITYDSERAVYLLYPRSAFFSTPDYDVSLSSWEAFYVWWFDPKKETLVRRGLPPGPWVDDAKSDGWIRGFKNFSCGVDCYRHYAIKAKSGNILVTITGRVSALKERTLGTYQLGENDTKWKKIGNGIPDS